MAYTTGEGLIATVIKAHANFAANNVAQAKWTQLDTGKSDHYVILRNGGTEQEFISVGGVFVAHHTTIAEVWKSYVDDGSTTTALEGYVANVQTQIRNNKKLGDTSGTIQHANAETVGPVLEMWMSGGGPAWVKQEVSILWNEQGTST